MVSVRIAAGGGRNYSGTIFLQGYYKKGLDINLYRRSHNSAKSWVEGNLNRIVLKIARLSKNPLAPHKIAPITSFPIVIILSYVILLP